MPFYGCILVDAGSKSVRRAGEKGSDKLGTDMHGAS
jgi:hypothetical protein